MPIHRPAEPALILMNAGFLLVVLIVYPSRLGRDRAVNWAHVREGPAEEQMASLGLVAGWSLQLSSLVGGGGFTPRRSTRPRVAAAALIATSTAGAVFAQSSLGPAWRTTVSGTGAAPLATTGPYRLVRHPVYTAMLSVLVSNVIVARTRRAIVGLVLGAAALEFQARAVEEPALKAAFGQTYAEYASGTGRFLPVIGRIR